MNFVRKHYPWMHPVLGIVSLVMVLISIYLVFAYAPTERTMGHVQRIFYWHVPTFFSAVLGFVVVLIGSIQWLRKRDFVYDRLARCGAELGVVFTALVLITGMLWAKPVWFVYWDWDPRLTSTLVLWLMFAGYLALGVYIEDETKRANVSAVLGILGFLNVPLVYFSIRIWRTLHPKPVIAGGEGSGLAPAMSQVFFFSMLTMVLFFIWLLLQRMALEAARMELEDLELRHAARLEP